jgi:hypothetical protein
MKLPKLPWHKSDNKDEILELYRQALAAYADPTNWSDGTLLRTLETERVERWRRRPRFGTTNFATNKLRLLQIESHKIRSNCDAYLIE